MEDSVENKLSSQTSKVSEPKQEMPTIAGAFTEFTGIEVTENEEVEKLRQRLRAEAERFLAPFRARGLLSEEDEKDALGAWENAIALDGQQLAGYGEFGSRIYRQAVEDLSEVDPGGESEEVQALIKQAEALVTRIQGEISKGCAYTCRPNLVEAGKAKALGLPEKWIIINWGRKDEFVGVEHRIKSISLEETAHLISKIGDYGGNLRQKWVEEMMARVLAFSIDSGHTQEDPYYAQIKEDLRVDEYLRLFNGITRSVSDQQTLLRAFFGNEPVGSEAVQELNKVLGEISFIGEVVDAGISLKGLAEYFDKVRGS